MTEPSAARDELLQQPGLLVSAAVGVGLSIAAIPPFVVSVFAGPMTAEFGWSLQAYQTGALFLALGVMFASPLSGWLSDRYQARRIALIGLPLFAAGIAAFSLVGASVYGYYAAMLGIALLSAGTLPIVWTKVVNSVFDRRRGLALGLVLSGSGIAGIFLPGFAQTLIDGVGWRGAWLGLACLPIAIGLPVCYFLLKPKARLPGPEETLSLEQGLTLGGALRGRRFWTLALSFFLVTFCLAGWNANLQPILLEQDFTPTQAAGVMGVLGATMAIGRIGAGFLIDKFWAPAIAAIAFALPAAGVQLVLADHVTTLTAAIAIAAFGLAHGAEFDFLAYMVARYFGVAHYGKIYGLLIFPITLATAAGAIALGRSRDVAGSFEPVLGWFLPLLGAAALLQLSLGRYPAKE